MIFNKTMKLSYRLRKALGASTLAFTMLFTSFASTVVVASDVASSVDEAVTEATLKKTVTLASTDSVSLAFDYVDESLLQVDEGATVRIRVMSDTPVDTLTLVYDDGRQDTIPVIDGTASLYVDDNVLVTSSYGLSINAEALALVSVKEYSQEGLESYIRRSIDKAYVKTLSDSFTLADGFHVTTSIIDGTQLPDADFDKLNEDLDHDGIQDHFMALMNQTTAYVALYDVGESDYYVGLATTRFDHARVTDYGIGKNNNNAELVDDVIYDIETGLVYVPKVYSDERPLALRMQQLVTTDAEVIASTSSTRILTNNEGVSGSLINEGDIVGNLQMVQTDIKLSVVDHSEAVIASNMIDSVEINGFVVDASAKLWTYDDTTGVLSIDIAPCGLTDVKVNMSAGFGKWLKRVFGLVSHALVPSVYAAESWLDGELVFNNRPEINTNYILDVDRLYINYSAPPVFMRPMLSTGHISHDTHVAGTMGWGDANLDLDDLSTMNDQIYHVVKIEPQVNEGVEFPSMKLGLKCSHLKTPLVIGDDDGHSNYDWAGSGEPIWTKGKANVRVIAVDDDSMILGVTVPTTNSQAGGGFFKSNWRLSGGHLSLQKLSANPRMTDKFPEYYSMIGAKYGVYSDATLNDLVATLTVNNADGSTNEVMLPGGTYWVKELPGIAKGYTLNPNVKQITVTAGQHNKVVLDGNMAEPITGGHIRLKKVSAKPTVTNNNESYSMIGAKYGVYKDASATQLVDSFVVENEQGFTNRLLLPLGSFWVKEVQGTAKGYGINPRIKPIVVRSGNNPDVVLDGDYAEPVKGSGLQLIKTSAQPDVTEGNPCYSMIGAKYGIYRDAKLTDHVATLTVQNESGETQWLFIAEGVYYVKELKGTAKGYLLNSRIKEIVISPDNASTKIRLDGEFAQKPMNDPISVLVQKSIEGFAIAGQPAGDLPSLQGVRFKVDYYSGLYNTDAEAKASGTLRASAVFVTDEKGEFVFRSNSLIEGVWPYKDGDNNTVPLGTIIITEIDALQGMKTFGFARILHIQADGDGEVVIPVEPWPDVAVSDDALGAYVNQQPKGGVTVTKVDAQTSLSVPQGDASLVGVRYEIVNKSLNPIVVNGTQYAVDAVVWTGASSYDASSKRHFVSTGAILPYGTYEIREVEASTGYRNAGWSKTFQVREDGFITQLTSQTAGWNANEVMRGGIAIDKVDRETKGITSLGEAVLGGATFAIVNRSENNVVVDGVTYKPGDVVKTMGAGFVGDRVMAQTGSRDLPYGTYEVYETSSGKGYLYDEASKAQRYLVTIREDNVIVNVASDGNKIVFDNQVSREDWHFKKKDDDSMERMAYVPFLVTSNTTGESHVIVTDENGTWGSSWNAHTVSTNANDPDAPNTNGAIIKDASGTYIVQDASKLDPNAGTWFTGLSPEKTAWSADGLSYMVNGETVKVNDALRSFPYDTYTVQELASKSNEGYQLVTFTVTLRKYGNHDGAGIDLDYGTISDRPFYISTVLTHDASGKSVPASESVTLTDVVSYDYLTQGDYTLKGELHLVDQDGNDEGVVTTAEHEFSVTNGTKGQQSVTFTVDTSDMAGKKLVAFEYLMQGNQMLAKHEELYDLDQTVQVVAIQTKLTGDLEHEAYASTDSITLVDTISYQGLDVGVSYTVTGTLMDKATGEPLLDVTGDAVTATTMFVPTSVNGEIQLAFVFTPDAIAGKTVVAFEEISKDGVIYAEHKDIDDGDQTVTFPSVETKAVDYADGDQEIGAFAGQIIKDTAHLSNLVVGHEYTVTGTLHLQHVGIDGLITDEGALSSSGIVDSENPLVSTHTFTADAPDRMVELMFDIDATELAGRSVVVFETLSRDGVTLGSHEDIMDENQTITIPNIGTTLTHNGGHSMLAGQSTLIDSVAMTNLMVGATYTLTGMLHLRGVDDEGNIIDAGVLSGKGIVDEANPLIVTKEFTADATDMTVDVEFEFDASKLAGRSVVAFETLSRGDSVVALHEDITDDAQAVGVPQIGTTLTGDVNHEANADANVIRLVDTVHYSNLNTGVTYELKGTLMDYVTGEPFVDVDGNAVTASTSFMPPASSGEVIVTFAFKANDLAGKTLVAFEELYWDGTLCAEHKDIQDAGQTVTFPSVATMAKDAVDGNQEIGAFENQRIVDTVAVRNLVIGHEYTLTGTLHLRDVDDQGNLIDVGALSAEGIVDEANPLIVTKEFTADATDMTVDVEFNLDVSELAGKTVVVFETLSRNGVTLGVHADITDESQSVGIPKIGTVLTDVSGNKEVSLLPSDAKQTDAEEVGVIMLVDRVSYEGLIPGREYTMLGTLHEQGFDDEGNIVDKGAIKGYQTSATFTPDASSGTVDITFKVNASELVGATVVAFESCYHDKQLIAAHHDITDVAQSVKLVSIGTTATDTNNKTHTLTDVEGGASRVYITDTVTYSNLTVGQTYVLDGTLHLQKVAEDGTLFDGGIVTDAQGRDVISQVHFVPETPNGSVDVIFDFEIKAGSLDGQTLVAFENLSHEGILIASHADIQDINQSVSKLEVGTMLTGSDGEAKEVAKATKLELIDKVSFEGLVVGEEYVIEGQLVTHEGKPLLDADKKPITSSVRIKPTATRGFANLKFVIDTSKMADGVKIIAVERVYTPEGTLVGHHVDLKDVDQTVVVKKTPAKTHVNLKTGVEGTSIAIGLSISLLAIATGAYFYLRRRRFVHNDTQSPSDTRS